MSENTSVTTSPYYYLIFLLVICNLLDTTFTLYYFEAYRIEEANPLLKYILDNYGVDGFLIAKTSVATVIPTFLGFHIEKLIARVGIWITTTSYLFLVLYHLYHYILFTYIS